ncbi:MAG: hypothetical protein U1F24_05005 [Alphaproteobacteria bacterium]
MPLQSKAFAGDKALEACAVSDPAHVVPGATGPHVRKIQSTLKIVDNAAIDAAEASAGRYGPRTADAVLAYKTRRGIINRAYQSTPDNIVGKMTIAALDADMASYEKRAAAPHTTCRFGCGVAAERSLRIAEAVSAAAWIPVPSGQARVRLPDARAWVVSAIAWLTHVAALAAAQRALPGAGFRMNMAGIEDLPAVRAVRTHFRAHQAPNTLAFLNDLLGSYFTMQRVLGDPDTFFDDDWTTKDFAYAWPGGVTRPAGHRERRIHFCTPYLDKGPLFQTAVIVHECAHFVDRRIGHVASELPSPNGTPVGTKDRPSSTNYADMSWDQALTNAYSYAQFALHAFKGYDYRITPFDE